MKKGVVFGILGGLTCLGILLAGIGSILKNRKKDTEEKQKEHEAWMKLVIAFGSLMIVAGLLGYTPSRFHGKVWHR